MRKTVLCSLFAVWLVCSGLAHAQDLSGPEKNFEYLWNAFDRNYAIFGPKRVDWQALYKVYRPEVSAHTSDDELFEIMSSMLGHLNDNHVRLMSEKPPRQYIAGILHQILREKNFKDVNETRQFLRRRPVDPKYIKSGYEERMGGLFSFGWVAESIGYFHFKGFENIPESTSVIEEILDTFKEARGIIVDVRKNSGGDDRVGKLIADRFADRKRLYMITYTRNGAAYDDFTPPKYWYVEPDGARQFTKPVILLINRFSLSAAENFALAMRVLPNVTLVGDPTSGVFADVYGDVLPNGWRFSVSYKLFVDYDGFCWEGIGVPPDLRIVNTKEDEEAGKDRVLEFAIRLLDSGALKPHEESGSLKNIRESLAQSLEENTQKQGIADAVELFYEAKKRDPSTYYIDAEEMDALGDMLAKAGKNKQALEVFRLNAGEHPGMWWVHQKLARAQAILKDIEAAAKSYDRAAALNPGSYPWEKEAVFTLQLEKAFYVENMNVFKSRFYALKAKQPEFARIAESYLNRFGYELLAMGSTKDAIEIFEINVEAFPGSWNAYDSLGEAYMEDGKKELSIKNYEKSIRLNPDNTNAKEVLKKLKEK